MLGIGIDIGIGIGIDGIDIGTGTGCGGGIGIGIDIGIGGGGGGGGDCLNAAMHGWNIDTRRVYRDGRCAAQAGGRFCATRSFAEPVTCTVYLRNGTKPP